MKRDIVEAKNNAETQTHTAEKQLSDWKYVSDAEKQNVRTLLQELRAAMDNPNTSKDDLVAATDKLQKAVMECGRTEYQQAAAANSNNSSSNSSGNQQQGEAKPEEPKKEGEQKQ